jgi:hypothetical protein
MAVEVQPGKIPGQHDGLQPLEADILKAPKGETVIAITTYERVKRVEDESKTDYYPVMKIKHIEPIVTADARSQAEALQLAAYQVRTGENQLDLDFSGKEEKAAKKAKGDE